MTKPMRKSPPRRREVAPAAELIEGALAARGITEAIRAHRIVTEWSELVGPRVAGRTWPDGLTKQVLWVRVANSAWLHELTLLKAQLVVAINTALGTPHLVSDIRFHLGARKKTDEDDALAGAAAAGRRRRPVARKPLPPPAHGVHLAKIESDAAAVGDDELRELIRNVRVKHDR